MIIPDINLLLYAYDALGHGAVLHTADFSHTAVQGADVKEPPSEPIPAPFVLDLEIPHCVSIWNLSFDSSVRVRPEDLRGLRAFGEDYPEATRLLIYRGDETLRIAGVLCLPAPGFLASLHPDRPLSTEA